MVPNRISIWLMSLLLWGSSCAGPEATNTKVSNVFGGMTEMNNDSNEQGLAIATFGAGCFWCTEAQFQQLKGVVTVESGYSGGHVENPTYKAVCSGTTGHAEVTQIRYDPSVISFDELLEAFFISHDPTQLNRQGNDVGTQYRSVVFYHSEEQKEKANYYIDKLDQEKAYSSKIVTEVSPFTVFYKAEDYHQDYYSLNKSEPYCMFVVKPKLEKFQKVFSKKLKNSN